MSLHSLFLAPKDYSASAPLAAIRSALSRLEVIGAPLDGNRFRAGPKFGQHVVFAGCSPYLPMEPPDDGGLRFCHVALHGPFDRPRLVVGAHSVSPRCPACRHRYSDWQARIQGRVEDLAPIECPSCHVRLEPCALDWRQRAACGRVLIELRNVFPGEAMPSDSLLAALEQKTGMAWTFAWSDYLLD